MLHIEAIVLYHETQAAPRVLRFGPGLNVITGWRNTGKSSLIEIVDYCFGRSTLTVSEGKVRDTVAWYALVLRNDDRYILAGRPAPQPGKAGSTEGTFITLNGAQPPDRSSLTLNCSVADLRGEISAFAGFADTTFQPPEGAQRPALDLHIGHALPITMQDEEDIYAKTRLFHRGDEYPVMQALRDTFPYMVGAADADAPIVRARLSAARAQLRRLERELDRSQAARQEGDQRTLTLINLAAEVGLADQTDANAGAHALADPFAVLRSALEQNAEAPARFAPAGQTERLLERRRQLSAQLRDAERDQALLEDFGRDRDAFSRETNEQRARLATINLVSGGGDHAHCPVCGAELENADPDAEILLGHLHALEADLEGVSEMEPRTRAALVEAVANVDRLHDEIRVVNGTLRELAQQDRDVRELASLGARRARVQGLIEEHLRLVPEQDLDTVTPLRQQRDTLLTEIEELESQVDTELEQERLQGALELIGADMTRLARQLKLEHADTGQVGLRLTQTTLTITTNDGRTFPLRSIGGGGTRVGYHLAAHLAIHRLLRLRDRSAPAFLLLDQPTGPFYPDNPPIGEEPQLENESDQAIVDSLFAIIRQVVDELDDTLQVVVTDHATFYDEDWFEAALVEDWRHGKGLIPDDWVT